MTSETDTTNPVHCWAGWRRDLLPNWTRMRARRSWLTWRPGWKNEQISGLRLTSAGWWIEGRRLFELRPVFVHAAVLQEVDAPPTGAGQDLQPVSRNGICGIIGHLRGSGLKPEWWWWRQEWIIDCPSFGLRSISRPFSCPGDHNGYYVYLHAPNGLRYLQVGGRGQYSLSGTSSRQKNLI